MAGEWIKMRNNLWDDPRVSSICDATGAQEAAVIGALYWLWSTADEHTEDGFMPGLSARAIDRKTGVQGFGAALIQIGWIAESDGGLTIVRFDEHNGSSAKKRAVTAKRVANHRSSNAQEPSSTEEYDHAVTHEALQDEHASVTGALAREEKRREEERHSVPNGTGSAAAPPIESGDFGDQSATRTGAPDGPACEADTSPDPPPPPHADPPTDPVKALFDLGLAVLRGAGSNDRAARSLIGKLRKAVGDGDAMSILVAAKDKTDPAAYIAAAMKPDPVADAIRQQMGGVFVERLGDGRYRCGGRVFNGDGSRRVALC